MPVSGLCPRQIDGDLVEQPAVAGQAEDIIDALLLAPDHQLLAGEAGVGAEQDSHLRPAPADAGDDARHLVLGAGRGVDVRTTQLRRQQLPAAEHVERQITVTVIIAVEKPPFLMTVQWIVGGIEVENDLPRRLAVRIEEHVDEHLLQRLAIAADLVIARASVAGGVLQPVHRALARQRRTVLALRLQLVGKQRQHRITAKGVVIVDILVAERDRDDPLAHQGRQRVDELPRIAAVAEACRHPLDQPDRPIRLAQQHCPGIRGHRSGVKCRHHATTIEPFEFELSRDTLCLHRTPHQTLATLCRKRIIPDSRGRCTLFGEISGLARSG